MNVVRRGYRDQRDLQRIGRLLRRAYGCTPDLNAWTVARFDIWAQRRIGDDQVFDTHAWQRDIQLWEAESGALHGAVLFESSQDAALLLDPDHQELAETMVAWAEAHGGLRPRVAEPLRIEVMGSHRPLQQLLAARSYTRLPSHFVYREKLLDPGQTEPVALAPGFSLRTVQTPADIQRYHVAVKAVFGFEDTLPVYQLVQQAPSFVPELDLMLVTECGDVASFASVWIDRDNSLAEFEPVGTVPAYRRRGLSAALLAEASNRLRALGCGRVIVNAWSESIGANKLYEAAGLRATNTVEQWQRGGAA